MPSVYAMVYRTGDETLITVPSLTGEAGNRFAAGFVGSEPAPTLTTLSGRVYPDPLADVWHLIPPTSRRRIRKLSPTDACIWVRVPITIIPGIVRNAAIRHGL